MITFGKAKKILSKYVGVGGRSADAPETYDFVIEVLQWLLNRGTEGNLRKFTFYSQGGFITLPKELKVPLKVKVEGSSGGVVRTRFFEFASGTSLEGGYDCMTSLLEDPNIYPTAFRINPNGERVGVQCFYEECDAHVIVKGEDTLGNRVYTQHKGKEVVGEYLTLRKGKLTTGQVKFANITEVVCSETKGYKELWSVDDMGSRNFLSAYEPKETNPGYKKSEILIPGCPSSARISLLGRIQLKNYYSDDDIIPFENINLLKTAAQRIQSGERVDLSSAVAQTQIADDLIKNETNYNRPNVGERIEINAKLLGKAIPSLRGFRRGYR